MKSNYLYCCWLLCSYQCPPPSPAIHTRSNSSLSFYRLIVVFSFHPQPAADSICQGFLFLTHFPFLINSWCYFRHCPPTNIPHPDSLYWAFRPEVTNQPAVPLSAVHLCRASAVFVSAMMAKSPPLMPPMPPVVESLHLWWCWWDLDLVMIGRLSGGCLSWRSRFSG